jgi:uroporphyrinogen decarboxylase
VRSAAQVERLRVPEPEDSVPFVLETVRLLARELPASAPLIGFAGAPFTLFCYAVEGRGKNGFPTARAFLYSEPEAAAALLDKLAQTVTTYLLAQAAAGAQALMVFDSWIGLLSPEAFRRFCVPALGRMFERLAAAGVPRIYFPHQGATLLGEVAQLPVEVVGIDWRLPLSTARAILGAEKAVQGNLDPAALFAPAAELERQAKTVLAEAGPGPGHIFNLGHGIERTTDPAAVARLVDFVHRTTQTTKGNR